MAYSPRALHVAQTRSGSLSSNSYAVRDAVSMFPEWTCLMALPYLISSPICRVFLRRNCVGGGWRRQRNAAAGNKIDGKLKLEARNEWVRDDGCNSSKGSGCRPQPNSDHRARRSFNERRLRTLPGSRKDAFVTKPTRASELFETIESTCCAMLQ